MPLVIGRDGGPEAGPTAHLGRYRAVDGSAGAPLHLDVDRPHAVSVVGKRGSGKSHTLGVIAEELAATGGVAPVVVDPMGAFRPMGAADAGTPATVHPDPTVPAGALSPRVWCDLLSLAPESGAGALVWQAAAGADTLPAMRDAVADADAPASDRRAAANHLSLAADWVVFGDGADIDLFAPGVTVLDLAGLARPAANAVLSAVAGTCYRRRVAGATARLPWLLVDETHAFFDGVAAGPLRQLLTRGRAPGVSTVLATQRPAALPDVAIAQTDMLLGHRLTSEADLEALAAASPTYLEGTLAERRPERRGDVLAVDDATESVHAARVRERRTPDGGASPRASALAAGD